MSSEHGIPELLNGVYEEDGPPLDDADIMLTSLPVDLLAEFHVEAGKRIAIKDKKLLEDLEKAGFKHNPYPGSLFIKVRLDLASTDSSRPKLTRLSRPRSTSVTAAGTTSTSAALASSPTARSRSSRASRSRSSPRRASSSRTASRSRPT